MFNSETPTEDRNLERDRQIPNNGASERRTDIAKGESSHTGDVYHDRDGLEEAVKRRTTTSD